MNLVESLISRLGQFDVGCLQKIDNIKWQDFIQNADVPEKCLAEM